MMKIFSVSPLLVDKTCTCDTTRALKSHTHTHTGQVQEELGKSIICGLYPCQCSGCEIVLFYKMLPMKETARV